MGMKEKKWRMGLVEKMEGHAVSGTNPNRKPPVTVSDMYRDANNMLGMLFKELLRFFGGDKAANRIKVGGGGSRARGTRRPQKKKGWF